MSKQLITSILSVFTLFLSSALSAQTPPPDQYSVVDWSKMPRETVEADDGTLEWAEYIKTKYRCPTCKGKKKQICAFCYRLGNHDTCPECKHKADEREDKKLTTCRTCAGEGFVPDILEKAPCPGCRGAGIRACQRCFGEQNLGTEGTDELSRCTVCRGTGHYKCIVCRGKRHVEVAKVGSSIKKAKAKDLKKALKALEAIEKGASKLQSTGNARKDAKLWKPLLRPGARYFRPLNKLAKANAELSSDVVKGGNPVDPEGLARQTMSSMTAGLQYYLASQRRLLELSLERAEHNEAIDK